MGLAVQIMPPQLSKWHIYYLQVITHYLTGKGFDGHRAWLRSAILDRYIFYILIHLSRLFS